MVNNNRHVTVFDYSQYNGMGVSDIAVIGCGAVGSRVAMELVRLGIPSFTVYDMDEVSEYNIANQCFSPAQIGENKAIAIKKAAELFGCNITAITNPVDENTYPHSLVFLCVDSMEVRHIVMRKWLINPNCKLIIETRMGSDEGRIYSISNNLQYKTWVANSSYKTEEAEESVCGHKTSVGATAGLVAMTAVWQLINYCNKVRLQNEIIVMTNPFDVVTNYF